MSELVKRELTLHDASRIANHPARTEPIRQYRDYQIISLPWSILAKELNLNRSFVRNF